MTATPPDESRLTWIRAGALADLAPGGARVVSHDGLRIAVFRTADGALAALDDRCPHEGYPLAKGFVNQGVVTCRWHAFRYDLKTGRCLVGDEHARVFPVRVIDDHIEVGVAAPDRDALRRRAEASLEHGLERRRRGQVARDVVRLLEAGATPRDVMRHAIHFDAARAPYGTTHVPALAWDLLGRLPGIAARLGEDGVVAALLQPLDLCADPLARHPPRPRPAPEDPGPDPDAALVTLRARVEAEDADGAEALVRGAVLIRGETLATLADWLGALVDDHLLDFGHAAIYLPKLLAWLSDEPPSSLDLVLGAFTRGVTLGTREELVPEWGAYTRHLDDGFMGPPATLEALREALVDGPRDAVVPAVRRALADHPRDRVIDQLVLAASLHLLRYDLAVERDPTVQEGWLDVTHALTLSSALRDAPPDHDRLVLLAAAFIHARRGLHAPPDVRAWDERAHAPRHAFAGGDLDDAIQQALEARDADAMLGPADALARTSPEALVDLLEDWCLTRGAGRAIFQAHHHKTMIAALAEAKRLATRAPALAHLPLVAAARFVAAPLQERSLMRLAHEANRFVKQSRVPRRLT
ncbi:MAG: Rieske (2Fe-2S) protein [Deltaproteobacteria bacterium]|nr:Rieske (2Fe-2S) protein [Deltaproteobacteria bacterium]